MPNLTRFDTPASLRDMPEGSNFYANWSEFVSGLMGKVNHGDNGGAFYNPTAVDVEIAGEKTMTWMGFPRDLLLPDRRDDRTEAFDIADGDVEKRARQNEYFEWRVERSGRTITKITFVTELGGYYEELWAVDRSAVVKIYRDLVDGSVKEADLMDGSGNYDPFNRWNTTDGIVHYIQNINNIEAAIRLCQDSVTSPPPARDNYEATPSYGTALTSVDPRIAYDVHMLIRKGLYVTLKDPIGLYILSWNNSGITTPDGSPAPSTWWKPVRGEPGMVMRLEYQVPPEYGFTVSDLSIGGRPIVYGGQLAEQVTVGITGTAGTHKRPSR